MGLLEAFAIMVTLGAESTKCVTWQNSLGGFSRILCLCLHADSSVAGLLFLGNKLLVTETITFSDTSMSKVLYHALFMRLEREEGRMGLDNSACK